MISPSLDQYARPSSHVFDASFAAYVLPILGKGGSGRSDSPAKSEAAHGQTAQQLTTTTTWIAEIMAAGFVMFRVIGL
jgi:hypothetical protein